MKELTAMAKVMTAATFAARAKAIAQNFKSLYVMGCFGAPMTEENKARYIEHHSSNAAYARKNAIMAASADTFGFDCVGLVKAILWGWSGDKNAAYGGAKYGSNGVPDYDADNMINLCTEISTDFKDIAVGELLWKPGHVGIYIGDGLAAESTSAWESKAQVTAVTNISARAGYYSQVWAKHGKLPFVDYSGQVGTSDDTEGAHSSGAPQPVGGSTAAPKRTVDPPADFDAALAGTYTVTAPSGLRIRAGAGEDKEILGAVPYGTQVECCGHFTLVGDTLWLFTTVGTLSGYMSADWLK